MENKDGGLGYRVKLLVPHAFLVVLWISYSIVPRPSLTVFFFAAVEKIQLFPRLQKYLWRKAWVRG